MKRFIKKVVFFVLYCALIGFGLPYAIDPYNVFHWDNIRNNGLEPNKNYIKTKYILKNPDAYDGFLFGSSRVGSIHVENIPDLKVYNMTSSLVTPEENYETLKTFIENNVNMDIVYIGVDSRSYTESPEEHYTQGLRAPYQYLQNWKNFLSLYTDPAMVAQSLPTILQGGNTAGIDVFYTYGWWCDYDRNTTIDWSKASASVGPFYRLEETLQDIQNIKDLCDANGIELVVFTNPMCEITYEGSLEVDYLEFLERLAGITDYYNFSGINDVTSNTDNYIDTSHYNAYVGDMILDTMINGNIDDTLYKQGFGWYVTSENVEDFLEILQG
jgi:hypothetical protein